jgi:putative transposase
MANIRADFTHKLTTRLGRENQALVIGDLNVKGMRRNGKTARAIADAARNLKRPATETALPVAGPSGNGGAVAGTVPAAVGNVTPVRYDGGQPDTAGQEANRAHFCAHS